MDFLIVIVVAAAAFGLFFLLDKGFTKLFRGKAQHRTGLSVRLSKRYASLGLIVAVLGIAAVFAGIGGSWLLIAGGGLLILVGTGLVIYYMTFGIFYDADSFILMTFGKGSKTYQFRDICGQQLYNSSGNIVVELYLSDGRTVQLQSVMEGAFAFLDKAFEGWLRQTGKTLEDYPFHDPENCCWFPKMEV